MRSTLRILPLTMLITVATFSLASAYEPGTSGLLFLRLGVGERGPAMGGAYTSLAADATAIYWNPAGLGGMQGSQLHLMHNAWMQSVSQEFVGVAHPTSIGTFGVGLILLSMDDLERREDVPTEEPLGSFSAFDTALYLSYGVSVAKSVQVGASVKWIYSRLDQANAKGFLFDLGIRHETVVPGLIIAAALLNLGPQFQYEQESFDAPITLKLGGALTLPWHPSQSDFNLAYDASLLTDSDTTSDDSLGESKTLNARHHLGGEFDYRGVAALRAGYKIGYDSQGASFGAGLGWRQFHFDYTYQLVENDLGDTQRLGLSLDF